MDFLGSARIACLPTAVSRSEVHCIFARNGRTFETENSLVGFAEFIETLLHRVSLAFGNVLFQFGQKRHSTTTK